MLRFCQWIEIFYGKKTYTQQRDNILSHWTKRDNNMECVQSCRSGAKETKRCSHLFGLRAYTSECLCIGCLCLPAIQIAAAVAAAHFEHVNIHPNVYLYKSTHIARYYVAIDLPCIDGVSTLYVQTAKDKATSTAPPHISTSNYTQWLAVRLFCVYTNKICDIQIKNELHEMKWNHKKNNSYQSRLLIFFKFINK